MMTTILLATAVAAAPVPFPRPKADGLLVVHCGDHLRFIAESGREVRRYTPPEADGWPAWRIGPVSPNLTRVILTANLDDRYTRTVIAPLDRKGRLRVIRPPGGQFSYPFWAADGERVIDVGAADDGAFGSGYHYINLALDVDSGRVDVLPLPTIKGGPPFGAVERLRLKDPDTYRRSLHEVVACSPTGDWYLTRQQKQQGLGTPKWLALVNRDGMTARRVLDENHYTASHVFAPGGTRAAFTVWPRDPDKPNAPARFDGVFVVDVKDVSLKRVVARPPDLAEFSGPRVAWSPDGKRIALGYHRRVRDGEFEFRVVSYTPDGRDPRTVFSVTGARDEVISFRLVGWH